MVVPSGEIALSAKDRLLRLRAKDAADAAAWVAAIMSTQLQQGADVATKHHVVRFLPNVGAGKHLPQVL